METLKQIDLMSLYRQYVIDYLSWKKGEITYVEWARKSHKNNAFLREQTLKLRKEKMEVGEEYNFWYTVTSYFFTRLFGLWKRQLQVVEQSRKLFGKSKVKRFERVYKKECDDIKSKLISFQDSLNKNIRKVEEDAELNQATKEEVIKFLE